ncbi:MAG TPA: arsenic resistance N-acetyltransferase ArsN2 [Longimicrobiales bacterium]|nr:arsenic resistance N-acetyltransferase ArsN2 [Longimicrobiales bacterium]
MRGPTVTGGGGARIRPAAASDLEAVIRLLEDSALPTAGVTASLGGFMVAEEDGSLVGVAGLEVHGMDGVLRSVAVDPTARGAGLGGRLTERVIGVAREAGLRRVYLLTTTAEAYFPRHGFRRIAREDTSPEVRRSVEFREACPASAVAMLLELE